MPPSGSQYGGGPQQPGYDDQYGLGYGTPSYGDGQPHHRYNFPSSPSPQHGPGHGAPYQQPGQGPVSPPMHQPPPEQPSPANAPAASITNQPLVRPYAMTGGRTRPRYQLAIEALVSTVTEAPRSTELLPEHQRIIQLCREIKSVAEISALLNIPLGVARILVADLAETGMVAIHQPAGTDEPGAQPDLTLLERVLSGLRKL